MDTKKKYTQNCHIKQTNLKKIMQTSTAVILDTLVLLGNALCVTQVTPVICRMVFLFNS